MTDTAKKKIPKEVAVSTVCTLYGLNPAEFSGLLELLGCINPEQKSKILFVSLAWAAKDMMENSMLS